MSEELRVRAEANSAVCPCEVRIDGEIVDQVLWADERTGEAEVCLLRDGLVYVDEGTDRVATEIRRGHVELVGVSDELRRMYLGAGGVPSR